MSFSEPKHSTLHVVRPSQDSWLHPQGCEPTAGGLALEHKQTKPGPLKTDSGRLCRLEATRVSSVTNAYFYLQHSIMQHYPTLVRTVIIKKSANNECWRACGEKGTLLHCWWERKLVQPLWKTVWGFLKKLNTQASYHTAIPLLGIHPEKTRENPEKKFWKDTCMPMPAVALLTIAKTWKQPKCPSAEEWAKKMWYVNTHNGILLHHRKEQNNAIWSNMDGPRSYHKSEKDRYLMDITYMWNLIEKWYE